MPNHCGNYFGPNVNYRCSEDDLQCDSCKLKDAEDQIEVLKAQLTEVKEIATSYGWIDGDHHKNWVIDQMLRAATGDDYEKVIEEFCNGEDGPNTYSWDEGTSP